MHGMQQESQQVQCHQRTSKILRTMSKIVFKMIVLGLQGVVVLALNLPSGAPHPGKFNHVGNGHKMVGNKTVLIEHLAVFSSVIINSNQLTIKASRLLSKGVWRAKRYHQSSPRLTFQCHGASVSRLSFSSRKSSH